MQWWRRSERSTGLSTCYAIEPGKETRKMNEEGNEELEMLRMERIDSDREGRRGGERLFLTNTNDRGGQEEGSA